MSRYIIKSALLLILSVTLCCIIYPAAVWVVARVFFRDRANGSLLTGPDDAAVGSKFIAEPFTRDEYFQPRPSAAGYDGSASAASTLAASNYLLRDRVARMLGPIVRYRGGLKAGRLVAPDIEAWFQQDTYQGRPHIVAQWAEMHNGLAQAWINADSARSEYVANWMKAHPDLPANWIAGQTVSTQSKRVELAVAFLESFSRENPGSFPCDVSPPGAGVRSTIEPLRTGREIQSMFFDMWRQDHPDEDVEEVPGDMVTTSASGLDPDITLENAKYQLDRVASSWASDLKRDKAVVQQEINQILQDNAAAPFWGLAGEKLINVLEVNLELRKRYGPPPDLSKQQTLEGTGQ